MQLTDMQGRTEDMRMLNSYIQQRKSLVDPKRLYEKDELDGLLRTRQEQETTVLLRGHDQTKVQMLVEKQRQMAIASSISQNGIRNNHSNEVDSEPQKPLQLQKDRFLAECHFMKPRLNGESEMKQRQGNEIKAKNQIEQREQNEAFFEEDEDQEEFNMERFNPLDQRDHNKSDKTEVKSDKEGRRGDEEEEEVEEKEVEEGDQQQDEDEQEVEQEFENEQNHQSKQNNEEQERSTEEEVEEEDEDDQEYPFMLLKDMIDLNRGKRLKGHKRVIIDLSYTRYDVIHDVCEEVFQWSVQTNANRTDYNIQWIDNYIQEDDFRRMLKFQKVNHFPGSQQLGRKNNLGVNLSRMRNIFTQNYNFFPLTWLLPQQFDELSVHHIKNLKHKPYYIVKPDASSQGKGIYLTNKIDNLLDQEHYIVQEYIKNPLLIDDLKFDLRLYVLIKSIQPLKIFLFQEGLARFATVPYVSPNKSNIDNLMMHLTNYALNKKSPDFVQNEDIEDDDIGHKRSFSSILKFLYDQGYDAESLLMEIRQIIVKTIISAQPHMSHMYRTGQPKSEQNEMCFEILGFDIMMDANLKPYLIEVNHTPSFWTDSPLDLQVKRNLIIDTLHLINVNLKSKKKFYESRVSQQIAQRSLFRKKFSQVNTAQEEADEELFQQQQFEWEEENMGAYLRIYPSMDDPLNYNQFLKASLNAWEQQQQKKKENVHANYQSRAHIQAPLNSFISNIISNQVTAPSFQIPENFDSAQHIDNNRNQKAKLPPNNMKPNGYLSNDQFNNHAQTNTIASNSVNHQNPPSNQQGSNSSGSNTYQTYGYIPLSQKQNQILKFTEVNRQLPQQKYTYLDDGECVPRFTYSEPVKPLVLLSNVNGNNTAISSIVNGNSNGNNLSQVDNECAPQLNKIKKQENPYFQNTQQKPNGLNLMSNLIGMKLQPVNEGARLKQQSNPYMQNGMNSNQDQLVRQSNNFNQNYPKGPYNMSNIHINHVDKIQKVTLQPQEASPNVQLSAYTKSKNSSIRKQRSNSSINKPTQQREEECDERINKQSFTNDTSNYSTDTQSKKQYLVPQQSKYLNNSFNNSCVSENVNLRQVRATSLFLDQNKGIKEDTIAPNLKIKICKPNQMHHFDVIPNVRSHVSRQQAEDGSYNQSTPNHKKQMNNKSSINAPDYQNNEALKNLNYANSSSIMANSIILPTVANHNNSINNNKLLNTGLIPRPSDSVPQKLFEEYEVRNFKYKARFE